MAMMKFREPNKVLWRGVRPGHNGEQIVNSAEVANAIVILHTTTAGKVFYLCSATCMIDNSAGAGSTTIRVRDDEDVAQYNILYFTKRAIGDNNSAITFWPPLEIPAGWDIVVESTADNNSAIGFIFGWEE